MKPAASRRPSDVWLDPAARSYLIVGLAAAAVLALALMERGAGLWAVLAPLVAAAGLAFCWTSAPVFVLLGIAISLLITQSFVSLATGTADLILAAAVVVYVLSHYRLCAVATGILPPDPRRPLRQSAKRSRGLPAGVEFLLALTVIPYLIYLFFRRTPALDRRTDVAERRDGATAAPDELPRALAAAGAATVAAATLWHVTADTHAPLNADPRQWHLGVVIWWVVLPVAFWWAVTGYRAWRRATPELARLALNEFLWKETRREHRRIGRWTAWARLRQESRA